MSSIQSGLDQQAGRKRTVADVMTTGVVTAHLGAPLKEIAIAMTRDRISAVPVIGGTREVLGVVTATDLLRHLARTDDVSHARSRLLRRHDRRTDEVATAQTLMSWPATTLTPDTSIAEATRVANAKHLHFIPVVRDGTLVGCVTAADLGKVYVRSDEAIREEIQDRVIRNLMLLDPASFGLDVQEGVVAMTGMLDTRNEADQLIECVESVPGVVGVRTHFTFREDTGDV